MKHIKRIFFILLMFFLGLAIGRHSVHADSFFAYDGNLSSTYITYFRDIDIGFFDDYVCWRNGDYSFMMFVSDSLEISGSGFSSGAGKLYEFYLTGNYNNTQHYRQSDINNFTLNNNNHYVIYSSLGTYPKLERSLRYEKLEINLLFTACLFTLIGIIYKCINIKPFGTRKGN